QGSGSAGDGRLDRQRRRQKSLITPRNCSVKSDVEFVELSGHLAFILAAGEHQPRFAPNIGTFRPHPPILINVLFQLVNLLRQLLDGCLLLPRGAVASSVSVGGQESCGENDGGVRR